MRNLLRYQKAGDGCRRRIAAILSQKPAEDNAMILQTAGLSPSQKASLEDKAGRKPQDAENIVCCGRAVKIASEAQRQNAALQMRYQLSLIDRSQRRMSIEEYMAALMGESDAELTT
jgi:hypothetical protein